MEQALYLLHPHFVFMAVLDFKLALGLSLLSYRNSGVCRSVNDYRLGKSIGMPHSREETTYYGAFRTIAASICSP
ncbi:hypothetical protein [Cohnella yongneupensis]|uniref:Uncharacterized protein n=1 Tax=Cohnella yongneupensis TaxID=425006 RepID=A0ABW0QUV0_9BACL